MKELTSIERISRQLSRQSVDRIGASEGFWEYTIKNWRNNGDIGADEWEVDHFNLDILRSWCFNLKLDPNFKDQIIDEDEDTITYIDGNFAKLRRHKKHDSTPEHIGYDIANREDWEARAKDRLLNEKISDRLNLKEHWEKRDHAKEKGQFFVPAGLLVFESLHPICGHENMLMGMALDPDWVREMTETYTNLQITLLEELFAMPGGKPDGIWFYDDMGFKERPFMSPQMYREIIMPSHKKMCDFLHGKNLKVILHSCGFIEPLLPGIVEAGFDCLQAMEVKAGMDLLRIYQDYGDKISLMGGLDVRPVANNDLPGIKKELESKIPIVKQKNGFILHSDHSIPESTHYETYRYFLDLGRKLGTY